MKTTIVLVLGLVIGAHSVAANQPPSDSLDTQRCLRLGSCKDEGRCTLRNGFCVAASDADCKQSGWCKMLGRCTAREGKCVK